MIQNPVVSVAVDDSQNSSFESHAESHKPLLICVVIAFDGDRGVVAENFGCFRKMYPVLAEVLRRLVRVPCKGRTLMYI